MREGVKGERAIAWLLGGGGGGGGYAHSEKPSEIVSGVFSLNCGPQMT